MIGFTQMLGSISSLIVAPANPNNTDTVYIYAELLFTSSGCPLDFKSFNILGNNILASTQHCIGIAAAICNTTDTFKLNPLLAGTYLFDLTLSSGGGGPPCTAGIVPDDNDIISFSVVNSVGIEEHTINKELLKVTDLLGRETKGTKNKVLFYTYDDGTVEKRIVIE
ncbi:MAG: hypothetical protein ACKVIV_08555 [Flavobacteriales bacterium]|jgi:hypothetical protein|nr:hypothetical protein [Flavobacteriales bacterium]|tara:strand:- start:1578 stop:2078 length:501 start_codon:yes stop_codon:yes gene_type:complete